MNSNCINKKVNFAKKAVFLYILLNICLSVSYSQKKEIPQQKKVAIIDKFAFDDQTGIKKLYQAYVILDQSNCFPLHWSEISMVNKELQNPNLSNEEREKRKILLENLSKEQKENNQKRGKILIDPVLSEISDLLKKVEIQNNIILDKTELEAKGQLLVFDQKFDITKTFIAFFNERPRKSNDILKFNIPDGKIAVINTEMFFDKQKGISGVDKKENYIDSADFCSKTKMCQEIGKAIQSFAEKEGFSFIFDSSKDLPAEIRDYQVTDVTEQFITEYNNSK